MLTLNLLRCLYQKLSRSELSTGNAPLAFRQLLMLLLPLKLVFMTLVSVALEMNAFLEHSFLPSTITFSIQELGLDWSR